MADRRTMSWHFAALFSWLIGLVLGHPWIEPRETKVATATANWNPAPTRHVSAEVDLLRRDIYPVSVCGWIGAKVASPAYCSTSSSCVWNSDSNIVGCCTTSGSDCAFYTGCIDLKSPAPVGDRSDIFTCRGTSVCYLNTYPNNYHQWGCGAATWATTIATTYPGMGADISLQIVFTGAKTAGSSTSSAISASSTVNSTSSESSSPLQNSPPSSGNDSPVSPPGSQSSAAEAAQNSTVTAFQSASSSSNSSAAAIGGGIGGVIGALLLALLISTFCWWLKNRLSIKIKFSEKKEDNQQGHEPTVLSRSAELPVEGRQYELA